MAKRIILLMILEMGLIVPTIVHAQKAKKKKIAVQLYSLRDEIGSFVTRNYNHDYMPVFRKLAKMGYTGIEAVCYVGDGKFYGRSPETFRLDVKHAGLQVLSSHCAKPLKKNELESGDFSESMMWWKDCIKAHKAVGVSYIVTPTIGKPATIKELQTYCNYLNAIGELCRENGIKYGYHNHSHEFQLVEGKEKMMDYLLQHTNPNYVFFEMDVYWVVLAKESPVAYFKKYPGRFKLLHIKDYREIGQSGMVGFDAIFRNAQTAGLEYPIVELEQASKSMEEGLKISIDYLIHAPFVKATYQRK